MPELLLGAIVLSVVLAVFIFLVYLPMWAVDLI